MSDGTGETERGGEMRKGLAKSCGMMRRKKWVHKSIEERYFGQGMERSKEGGRRRWGEKEAVIL